MNSQDKWLASHDFGTISDACLPIKPLVSTWQDLLLIETTLPFALCSIIGGIYVIGRLIFLWTKNRRAFEAIDVFYTALVLNAVVVGGIGGCLYAYTTLAQTTACPLAVGVVGCKIQHTIIWWIGTFSGLLHALLVWHGVMLTYMQHNRRQRRRHSTLYNTQNGHVTRNVFSVIGMLLLSAIFTLLPVNYNSVFVQQKTSGSFDDGMTLSCEEDFMHVNWLRTMVINFAVTLPVILMLVLGLVFCFFYIGMVRQASRIAGEWDHSVATTRDRLAQRFAGTHHQNSSPYYVKPTAPLDDDNVYEPSRVSRFCPDEIEVVRDGVFNTRSSGVTRPVSVNQHSMSARTTSSASLIGTPRYSEITYLKQRLMPLPWLLGAALLTWLPYFVVFWKFMYCTWTLPVVDQEHDSEGNVDDTARVCMTSRLSDARQWATVVWFINQTLVVLIIAFKYPLLRGYSDSPVNNTGSAEYARRRHWLSNSNFNNNNTNLTESTGSSRRSSAGNNDAAAAGPTIASFGNEQQLNRGGKTGWTHLPLRPNGPSQQVVEVALTSNARF